jgi:peroxiredoxin
VAIGAPREQRRAAINDMKAPDFVLPNIDGLPMNFSDHRSKKRLLVAFSSW